MGNRAIRDHVADGKDLYLFKQVKKGFVSYVGQMVYTGHQLIQAPDKKAAHRKAIVFELSQIDAFLSDSPSDGDASGANDDLAHDSLAELRQKALADSAEARTPSEHRANWRKRSRAIRRYVLKRAGDKCEGCEAPAPFKTAKGQPYLEPHHIRSLPTAAPIILTGLLACALIVTNGRITPLMRLNSTRTWLVL